MRVPELSVILSLEFIQAEKKKKFAMVLRNSNVCMQTVVSLWD